MTVLAHQNDAIDGKFFAAKCKRLGYRGAEPHGRMALAALTAQIVVAARLHGAPKIFSTQMYLPMPDGRTTLANFFSPLVANMEQMFLTGVAPYPIERTLLTTGLTAAGVESLYQDQKRIATPHLSIRYQAPKESTFERA